MEQFFEWDPDKAATNAARHGVTFGEAATVFADPRALYEYDAAHSTDEDRFHAIGMSARPRVLLVVHCERGELIRIISARPATPAERRRYEQPDP